MKKTTSRLLGVIAVALSPILSLAHVSQAEASPIVCGERAEVIKTLAQSYMEKPSAMGLAAGGGMLEVFSSQNGSWTILITQPTGTSCIVAAGEGWESITQTVADTRT